MILRSIQEAPLKRANYLLNQEKSKKTLTQIQEEIESLSQTFGKEFDKGLYVLLLDAIDFKTSLQSKNLKVQYFSQEFQIDLSKDDFINFFAEVLMKTKNSNTVNDILEGLLNSMKLTIEDQLKILLSFYLSKNPRYSNDALYYLNEKCQELQKENKTDLISPSLSKDIIFILSRKNLNIVPPTQITEKLKETNMNNIIHSEEKKDGIDKENNGICFFDFIQNVDENKKNGALSDIETLLSMLNPEDEEEKKSELIPMEKLYEDLGPMIINKGINLNLSKSNLIDDTMTPKRVADFIINVLKKPVFTEDKEILIMNKIFLKSLELDQDAKNIDESIDKQQTEWNIENFYKMYKNQIDNIEPKEIFNYLDNPDFVIKDKKKFDTFLNILKVLGINKKGNFDLFFDFIFTKWENEENQIDFLQF